MPKACRVLSISASEKSRFAIGGPPWFAFSVPAESPASRGMLVAKRKIIPIVLTYASLTRSAYAYRLLKSTLRCWVPLCQAGLLALFSSALVTKLNLHGLARYEKAIRVLPDDARWRAARFGTFLHCLGEKLTPKDKQALIKATDMPKSDPDEGQKIEARAKKLETPLRHIGRLD